MGTSADRKIVAEIAINTRLANMTADERHEMTAAAKKCWLAKFEREVDPNEELPPDERRERAFYARREYMKALACKSVAARNAYKKVRLREALAELESGDDEAAGA
jgi:hypothetical protein